MQNFKNILRINLKIEIICFQLNRIKLLLPPTAELPKKNEDTCIGYSQKFSANDSSMNGT